MDYFGLFFRWVRGLLTRACSDPPCAMSAALLSPVVSLPDASEVAPLPAPSGASDAPVAKLHTAGVAGRGSYGCVFRGTISVRSDWPLTQQPQHEVAVKSFRSKASSSARPTESEEEQDFACIVAELLGTDGARRLDCASLVPRLSVLRANGGSWLDWHVVMESALCDMQCGGFSTPMPLRAVRRFGAQVAQGLAFLHSRGLAHRDVKASNVLLKAPTAEGEPWRAWLADWGMAMMRPSSTERNVCTAWYRAPEILLGLEHTVTADVWSFGVLLRRMAVGREFLSCDDHVNTLLDQMFQRIALPAASEWPEMHSCTKYRATIEKLEERERPSANIAPPDYAPNDTYGLLHRLHMQSGCYAGGNRPMGHALALWTARLYGSCSSGRPAFSPQLSAVLQACLQPNPARRPTMAQVLAMPFFSEYNHDLGTAECQFMQERADLVRQEQRLRPQSPVSVRDSAIGLRGDLLPSITLRGTLEASLLGEIAPVCFASSAALIALLGGSACALGNRCSLVLRLCEARTALDLHLSTVFYALDFLDRVAAELHPSQLPRATAAALYLAQCVTTQASEHARLAEICCALGMPAKESLEVREYCCRMLSSLRFSVHGGGQEDASKWSTWKALIAASPSPDSMQVSTVLVGLCVWPLFQEEESFGRRELVASCALWLLKRASHTPKELACTEKMLTEAKSSLRVLVEIMDDALHLESFRESLQSALALPTAASMDVSTDETCSTLTAADSVREVEV